MPIIENKERVPASSLGPITKSASTASLMRPARHTEVQRRDLITRQGKRRSDLAELPQRMPVRSSSQAHPTTSQRMNKHALRSSIDSQNVLSGTSPKKVRKSSKESPQKLTMLA